MKPKTIQEHALEFVDRVFYEAVKAKKTGPLNSLEVEGLAHRILYFALDTYINEQLQNGSLKKGSPGTGIGPGQVQKTGVPRGTSESSEGIREANKGTAPGSNKKKRRSKKA